MNSRQRILESLEHREPDRMAVDFGGIDCSSIHFGAYERLLQRLDIDCGPARLVLPENGIVEVDEPVMDRFGTDARPLAFYPRRWREWRAPEGTICLVPEVWRPERLDSGDWVLRDGAGVIRARKPEGSPYFDSVNPMLAQVNEIGELSRYKALFERWDWPAVFDESVEEYGERARRQYAKTDRAVAALWRMHFLQAGQTMRGHEQFFLDLLENEGLVRAIFDRLLEVYIERAGRFLAQMRDAMDLIFIADDFGTQGGPMVEPGMFRRLIKPYFAELFDYLKRESGKPIILHSCGAVREFIPDFIEIGVDALNPVQISARGMDGAALKRDFGRDITFWGGGCDTQEVLSRGTPGQVRDHVRRQIDIFAPGGGFVFTQVHNIQADVPPENVIALYDAAREFGG